MCINESSTLICLIKVCYMIYVQLVEFSYSLHYVNSNKALYFFSKIPSDSFDRAKINMHQNKNDWSKNILYWISSFEWTHFIYGKFVQIHTWTWKNVCISQNVRWDCTDQTVKTIAVFIVQSPNNVTLELENVSVDVRLDGKALHVMQVRQELTWLERAC